MAMTHTMVDVPSQEHFWNEWHRWRGASGTDTPHADLRDSFLAEMKAQVGSDVVDLGCGQGHDALAFARSGLTVHALDFSPEAIAKVENLSGTEIVPIKAVLHDLRRALPFDSEAIDGVYSHLALHYFDDETTRSIFGEIRRVLRPGGLFVFSVKSTADPHFGTGDEIGPDIYCRNGHLRHFFSVNYTTELLRTWQVISLTEPHGRYASSKSSAFIHVVAHKPD